MAWAIGQSVHRTERPTYEWVEAELTKTVSMTFPRPEVVMTHLVYKFIKQWGDLRGHHQKILDVQQTFDLTS